MWELTAGQRYCDGCAAAGAPCASTRRHECWQFATLPVSDTALHVLAVLTNSLLRSDGHVLRVDVPAYLAACRAMGVSDRDALWALPWVDAALEEARGRHAS